MKKKGPTEVPSMITLPWAVRPHCEVVTHTFPVVTACGGNQALGQQPWEFWFNGIISVLQDEKSYGDEQS